MGTYIASPASHGRPRDRFALKAQPDPVRPLWAAATAFFLPLLLYVGLTPWVISRWPVTGDEPHYLLVAHSLLADGDIDMANNYTERQYARFFQDPWLDPHVVVRSDGRWYPVHEIALSILLAPFYGLAGRLGALYFLNVVAALVAANVWLLAHELARNRGAAWFAWLAATFTVPLLPYSFAIYTEILGALLVIWFVRHLLQPTRFSVWRWASLGLCLVALPWLVIRFLPLALALLGWLAVRAMARREVAPAGWLAFSGVAAAGYLAISRLNHALYGDAVALGASSAGRGTATLAQLFNPLNHLDSLLGWLLDQRMGLLAVAPIYTLAFLGGWILLRRNRWAALVLGSLLLLQHASLGFTRFQVRWGIPPRYLVAVLPLAGGLLAVAWEALRGILPRILAALMLALSLLSSGLIMAAPLERAYHDDFQESQLWRFYSEQVGVDLNRYLPMFMPSIRYKDKGWKDIAQESDEPTPYLLPQFRTITSPVGALAPDPEAAAGLATTSPSGTQGVLLQGPQISLPPGRYELRYRLQMPQGDAPEGDVAAITLQVAGETLAQRQVGASDLSPAGAYHEIAIAWAMDERAEVSARLMTTGLTELAADYVTLAPQDVWPARRLAAAWLLVIIAVTTILYVRWSQQQVPARPQATTDAQGDEIRQERACLRMAWVAALASVGLIAWGLYGLWGPKRYEAEGFLSQTGGVVEDASASGGAAMKGRLGEDEAGWLVYGPYELFEEGEYRLVVRMRRGDAVQGPLLGWVDVTDVEATTILARRDIQAADLEEGGYRPFALAVHNPEWQKLVFRVYFYGVSDLLVDQLEFHRDGGPGLWHRPGG